MLFMQDIEDDGQEEFSKQTTRQVIIDTLFGFLQCWIPLVLRVRRVYPPCVFVTPVNYPPHPASSQPSPSGYQSVLIPMTSTSIHSKAGHPFFKTASVAEYVDAVLSD